MAATTLSAGDIAIVGFNFDNPDELAFVPLIDIGSGTEIKFTDNGWQSSGSFRSNEGTFTWTASTDIAAGTVINPSVSSIAFSASGDQILAYQGSDSNPTFIYALNSEGSDWQSDATSSNTSALPTGLTNGTSAIALSEIDNATYTGITSGTQAELLAAIGDTANWSGSDSSRQTLPSGSFTVSGTSGGSGSSGSTTVFVNEIHYDNSSTDVNEGIEIAGTAGTDLSGWKLELYNGNGGTLYSTVNLSGTLADQSSGFGTKFFGEAGVQNGSPDGIALIDGTGAVVQFLSYEGTLTAVDGTAVGLTSTDIGVSESSSTPVGHSLQLTGTGSSYEEFTWAAAATSTYDAVNNNQTFVSPEPVVFVNEIHYDNDGTDTNEGIEIAGTAGTDLTGWTLELYNGNGGSLYSTVNLSGTLADQNGGFGTKFFAEAGVQNGSPDGIALIDDTGAVVQFLSYEGSFTAVGGTANGLTSTDIGVSESSSTPIGHSLQLTGTGSSYEEFTWAAAATSTYDAVNNNQTFGGSGGGSGGGGGGGTTTPIFDIQGSGLASTFDGQGVTTSGVVVGDFQASGELSGFFIQDATGDSNAATSDGIFVYAPNSIDVAIGDLVEVTGTVDEFYDRTQIGNVTALNVIGSGSIAATSVNLPVADANTLEQYEGMLVTLPQTLTVSENYNLGRYGEVVLSNGRLFQPTQVATPGANANAVQAANDLNRIVLDDGSTTQNPDPVPYPGTGLTATNTLRGGDTVGGVTGALDYAFGEYRVQATAEPTFTASNPRTTSPDSVGTGVEVKVASYNVLNYFNGDGNGGGFPTARGADTYAEFQRQHDKIVEGILGLDADVIGLMELENDGYGSDSAIQDLVDGLNAAQTTHTYSFVDPGTSQLGSDAIAVGIIYRDTVTEAGAAATISSGAFSDKNRQPLAQTFSDPLTGEKFTVAVNHFKSKGGTGTGADADQGDGQGNWNATRTAAANDLTDWLTGDPTGSNDPDFLIVGDLNAYAQEDPVTAIKNAGYTDLLAQFNSSAEYYSYVFFGQAGALDHALASSSLAPQVTGATEWHTNTDEPRILDYNMEYKSATQINSLYAADAYRASDHDPLVVGLNLG